MAMFRCGGGKKPELIIKDWRDNNTGTGGTLCAFEVDTTNFTKLSIESWVKGYFSSFCVSANKLDNCVVNLNSVSMPLVDFDISEYDSIWLQIRHNGRYAYTGAPIAKNIKFS